MSTPNYSCEPQQRILRLLLTLAGNEVNGLAPGEIAKLQGCSPSVATRDLANLAEAGLAEKAPETGLWRLAPQMVQIAVQFQLALARAEDRLAETRNRFTRG